MSKPSKTSRLSIEGLLQLVQKATGRLKTLSSDPKVQQEAVSVGKAVSRLLQAMRESHNQATPRNPATNTTTTTATQSSPQQDEPK
jgi:hypothetical protein